MQNNPTAIIAEDEGLLRNELSSQLNKIWPELNIVALAENGPAALEEIAVHKPDIAFLDIRMPGLTGLHVAAALKDCSPLTHIVFVTAYQQYAIDAFEKSAVDYLLKLIQPERLAATVARLKTVSQTPNSSAGGPLRANLDAVGKLLVQLKLKMDADTAREPIAWITAGAGKDTRLIMIDDVAYFQADSKYTVVMTADGEALIRTPIIELLDRLNAAHFKQIHRATIVNLRAIKTVSRDDSGKGMIKLKARPETLSISQPFMHLFRNM
jgi:DNA-binding LytR/AlgR family response regulator